MKKVKDILSQISETQNQERIEELTKQMIEEIKSNNITSFYYIDTRVPDYIVNPKNIDLNIDNCAIAIAKALKDPDCNIFGLNIMSGFRDKGVIAIAGALKDPNCKVVKIQIHCFSKHDGIRTLVEALSNIYQANISTTTPGRDQITKAAIDSIDQALLNTKSTKLMSLKISYGGRELLISEKSKEIISQNGGKFIKIAANIPKYLVFHKVEREESKESEQIDTSSKLIAKFNTINDKNQLLDAVKFIQDIMNYGDFFVFQFIELGDIIMANIMRDTIRDIMPIFIAELGNEPASRIKKLEILQENGMGDLVEKILKYIGNEDVESILISEAVHVYDDCSKMPEKQQLSHERENEEFVMYESDFEVLVGDSVPKHNYRSEILENQQQLPPFPLTYVNRPYNSIVPMDENGIVGEQNYSPECWKNCSII
jgi:hypothetical protein